MHPRFLALALTLACAPLEAELITVDTPADEFGENTSACPPREALEAANTDAAFGGCPAGYSMPRDAIAA